MRITDLPLTGTTSTADDRRRHIVPHEDGWAVKKEGSDRATAVFGTKTDAMAYGVGVCRNQGGVLVIHRNDGTVQDTRDYAS